jgi:hypothetical protein
MARSKVQHRVMTSFENRATSVLSSLRFPPLVSQKSNDSSVSDR